MMASDTCDDPMCNLTMAAKALVNDIDVAMAKLATLFAGARETGRAVELAKAVGFSPSTARELKRIEPHAVERGIEIVSEHKDLANVLPLPLTRLKKLARVGQIFDEAERDEVDPVAAVQAELPPKRKEKPQPAGTAEAKSEPDPDPVRQMLDPASLLWAALEQMRELEREVIKLRVLSGRAYCSPGATVIRGRPKRPPPPRAEHGWDQPRRRG